jgi:hypothetical protein
VEHNWTHIPGLWKLPYFHKLLVPHNIDVMHTEKMLQRPFLTLALTFQIRQKIMSKLLDQATLCNRTSQHGAKAWFWTMVQATSRFLFDQTSKKGDSRVVSDTKVS